MATLKHGAMTGAVAGMLEPSLIFFALTSERFQTHLQAESKNNKITSY